MWGAFKALSMGVKIGILVAFLAILGSLMYVSYQKGVNVSRVEIQRYEKKSREQTAKIATLQGKTDVKLVTVYKDRVAYVDRVQYRTKTVIQQSVPEQFTLSKGWVYVYNQSVAGLEPQGNLASAAEASGITDRMALETATSNNAINLVNAARLEGLQNWIRETEANRKAAVNEK